MSEKIIYAVYGEEDYECSVLIKAFFSRKDALEFMNRCTNHQKKRPDDANDSRWNKWESEHPAGEEGWMYDEYSVREITIK